MFQTPTPTSNIPATEYNFDLNALTAFNPALVYGFDCEASVNFSPEDTLNSLLHGAAQYQDMLNAYLYAQNTILPAIKSIGIANITQEQLLEWLDQIHLRIAATLALDQIASGAKGIVAGTYTRVQILHWHTTGELHTYFAALLEGIFPLKRVLAFTSQQGIKDEDALRFIKLLERIRDDASIKIPEDQLEFIDGKSLTSKGDATVLKLAGLYHTGRLTEDERKIVDKFIKIFNPSQFPKAREEVAKAILAKWRTCDGQNIEQLSDLAYTAFHSITETHWYFNANGRTATCFMNCVFRSFNKPSILLRLPNERSTPNSAYSKAIANINSDPRLFIQHVKSRLQETEARGDFQDKDLATVITLRVKLAALIAKIKSEFPACDVKAIYDESVNTCTQRMDFNQIPDGDYNKLSISLMNSIIDHFAKIYADLKQPAAPITPAAVIQRAYTPEEKQKIIALLEKVTGEKAWKAYVKNGLIVLLELTDRERAATIVGKLNETQAVCAKLLRHAKTKEPVVSVTDINLDKLQAVIPVPSADEPARKLHLNTPGQSSV